MNINTSIMILFILLAFLMVKVVSHINNTGIAKEKIDHENIFVGEYKWR
tara:strand:- start:48 stop:194 length:147 start_codon:yes stop_codon:yes gene_type:complete